MRSKEERAKTVTRNCDHDNQTISVGPSMISKEEHPVLLHKRHSYTQKTGNRKKLQTL